MRILMATLLAGIALAGAPLTSLAQDAVIEKNTTLLPLSLVLKEVNLLPGTYEGSPAEPVETPLLPPPAAQFPAVKELVTVSS